VSDDGQANPLVETKLHIPSPRRNLVARPRLQARVADAADAKLILVSAPAGFGKTTLVTSWLSTVAGEGAAVAWLSLDERDNDPALFWPYVLAALECVDAVTAFDEDTPLELVLAIRPDVLVKGGDYTPDTIVGRAEVEAWGGRVHVVPLTAGHSTTRIIEALRGS